MIEPPLVSDYVESKAVKDPRIRAEAHGYRVVFPDGKQRGPRFFVNNSAAVIEKQGKDARGEPKWDLIASYPKPGTHLMECEEGEARDQDLALYWLLAGPGAE